MTLNVTCEDLKIEKAVMDKVTKIYPGFKDFEYKQNLEDKTSLYDFYGFFLGVHRHSVDVKALYCKPDEYPSNIVSMDKWQEFIANQNRVDHFMVYFYPESKFLRIYDLGKGLEYRIGKVHIHHKRTNEGREDEVAFILSSCADFEMNGFSI
jgi:hypothetical protein